MGKIKKVFNVKIMFLLKSIILLCNITVYSYSVPASINSLRLHVGEDDTLKRIDQSMYQVAADQPRLSPNDIATNRYVGKIGYSLGKVISPEKAIDLIESDRAVYIEFEQLAFWDYRVISIIRALKPAGKKMIVRINNAKYPRHLSYSSLVDFMASSALVDYVVISEGDFSLRDAEYALHSNVYFIPENIQDDIENRIIQEHSSYRAPYEEVNISHPKYLRPEELISVITNYQAQGLSVGVITGVFDVLHTGHVEFLSNAKAQVDILILLINSDLSASLQAKNSRQDRPINSLSDRVACAGELTCVSHVVPFDSQIALPLLKQLSGVVFIKTDKDIGNPGIQAEMDAIIANGGRGVYVPVAYYENNSDFISTTEMIKQVRKDADLGEDIVAMRLDHFSGLPRNMLEEIVATIKRWDNSTKQVSRWKKLVQEERWKNSTNGAQIELQLLEDICKATGNIIETLGYSRDYHRYVIPYILGKMLQLQIEILPLQQERPYLPVKICNVAKLSDGRVVFLNSSAVGASRLAGPLKFEENYRRALPHHTNYKLKDRDRNFPKRVFLYPSTVSTPAISLRIFQEEYEALITQGIRPKDFFELEMEKLAIMIWETLEGAPFQKTNITQERREISRRLRKDWKVPVIIAHRGSRRYPENSSSAIIDALNMGVRYIELDVVACRDEWVVFHDNRVDVLTNGQGRVGDMDIITLQALRLLSVDKNSVTSERIMTLTEALNLLKGYEGVEVKIDIKYSSPSLEPSLVNLLKDNGYARDKIVVTSEVPAIAHRVHNLDPELSFEFNSTEATLVLLSYGLMDRRFMPKFFVDYVYSYGIRLHAKTASLMQFALGRWGRKISRRLVTEIQELGISTSAWVVGSKREFRECLDLGLSFVLMDDPEMIRYGVAFRDRFSKVSERLGSQRKDI